MKERRAWDDYVGSRSKRAVRSYSLRTWSSPDLELERPPRTELIGLVPGAQPLEGGAGREHVRIGVASSDDLHPDGQPPLAQSPRDRTSRMTGEVDEVGQAPADQGINGFAIDLGGTHGVAIAGVLDRQTRQGRGDQEIVAAQGVLNGIVDLGAELLIVPEVKG